MSKDRKWNKLIDKLSFCFQPIVNVQTGICFGYECILKQSADSEYKDLTQIFDKAAEEGDLFDVHVMIRKKMLSLFSKIENYQMLSIFLPVDNRIHEDSSYSSELLSDIFNEYEVSRSKVYALLSDKHRSSSKEELKNIIKHYSKQKMRIALDNFGLGFADIELLYYLDPSMIRMDRFFVRDINTDPRKMLLITNIIKMAQMLGVKVVLNEVNSKKEFFTVKESGCDYIQGLFISDPKEDTQELKEEYRHIIEADQRKRNSKNVESRLIFDAMDDVPCLGDIENILHIYHMFKNNKSLLCIPIVDEFHEPIGIIREKDMRSYIYTPFGHEILKNKDRNKSLGDFISPCPSIEISSKIGEVLRIFALNEGLEGIIVTQMGKYLGFLTAKSLIKLVNRKKLMDARDMNPLTRLPGNSIIESYLRSNVIDNASGKRLIAYFDFDNFKPFNDCYGFKEGDKAIALFADLLKKYRRKEGLFVGHIGGDDFFVGIEIGKRSFKKSVSVIRKICQKFRKAAFELYTEEDKERGYIESKDREGNVKNFPLLNISAAVIMYNFGKYEKRTDMQELSRQIAGLKKEAKKVEGDIKLSYALYGYDKVPEAEEEQ